ncbi:GTP cyclohydrolase II [Paenibacillus glufosinatiresistens]|uniref:GTP cyclohydrolase II n=1 Tax=Paenibacillus glufosinatiresistens TaxID=3070657 RepID=UPI00286DA3FB|nr:GTP cyclohydrolase II [Paenibacillus sp. YX.27]
MTNSQVAALLKDKIQTLPAGDGAQVLVGPIRLPVNLDGGTVTFQWYNWVHLNEEELADLDGGRDVEALIGKLPAMRLAEGQQSSVLVYGDFEHQEDALIRMHSICHTGDIFGSKRCDCGFQLRQSMRMIVQNGAGALFYLADHEGRGIGLFSKALAYLLQEEGMDTVEANLALGFTDDSRDYSGAIAVLRALRTKPVTLITNNPKKLEALKNAGMNAVKRIPLWGDVSAFNEKYLRTKIARSGHLKADDTEEILEGRIAQ